MLLFIYSLLYFFFVLSIFVLTIYGFTIVITVVWLQIIDNLLLPYYLTDVINSLPGLYTFAFLLVIIANSVLSLQHNTLTLSKKFISRFESPEKALSFWLNFKFLFLLITGIALVYYSITNYLSLLNIDLRLIAQSVDDSYNNIVMEYREINTQIAGAITQLLIHTFSAFILALLSKNHKFIAFLQALFLIIIIGICLFISFFYSYPTTMLNFINFLLIGSISACLISLLDNFFLSFINVSFLGWLHKQIKEKRYIKTPLKNKYNSPKQYLLSYALFISYSSLLNWSLLFYSKIEHLGEINNKVIWFCLITAIWLFLSLRFALLSGNTKINKPIIIPLAPVIIGAIYLGPLFGTFFLSWSKLSLSFGKFYSFYLALSNPTYVLSKNLQGSMAEVSSTMTFVASSPVEGLGSIFLEAAKEAAPYIRTVFEIDRGNKARDKLEAKTLGIEKLEQATNDPNLKAKTNKVLDDIYLLQNDDLSLEKKVELTNSATSNLMLMANRMKVCKEQLGSPRSGLVSMHNLDKCLELATLSEATAADSSLSTSTSAIAKAVVDLTEKL